MSPLWIVLALLPLLGEAERFNCKGRIQGAYYADAKSGCKAFHVCVRVAGGGVRDFRFFCPPGTLFHQEAQTCTDWGDDDPLACPADIYDGQFDLYKIGSGFDTQKLSSSGNRDDETEFGLQRAETGDRRLNNGPSNSGGSDLRAAHSSDFFSGARDRGRDDSQQQARAESSAAPQPSPQQRQSFRRVTSPRTPPTTTTVQYTTNQSPPAPHPPKVTHYDSSSKRKLVRKRPIYVSTTVSPPPPPSTLPKNSPRPQFFEEPQINFDRRPQNKQTPEPTPPTAPPANVPPQFKDEYVEVSRVTPKNNKYFQAASPAPFSQSSPLPKNHKKEGLVELYNYDASSTPGFNTKKNDNRPFKIKNSFNVSPELPREQDFVRTNVDINHHGASKGPSTTVEFSTASQRFASSTPAFRNQNSVSYEHEKNNFVQYSNTKQNVYNSPTTTQSTTFYTSPRVNPTANLNTVAYNTNIGFNVQSSNYADSGEDDGQYRLPSNEDDGQYRPQLYERELLTGAHSLNIAASGNRLPDDQKQRAKTQPPPKQVGQTAAPRPFRPAPTSTLSPTTRAAEVYTTRVPQTVNTQRTFDYFQTYTTTVRPTEAPLPPAVQPKSNAPQRQATSSAPRQLETRPTSKAHLPSSVAPAPHPTTRPPHFAKPANRQEDNSYDYAYYDSDPGFSEYDNIEEFGKTKSKA